MTSRKKRPIEEKESYRWLDNILVCRGAKLRQPRRPLCGKSRKRYTVPFTVGFKYDLPILYPLRSAKSPTLSRTG